MNKALISVVFLVVSVLACRMTPSEPRKLELYPSPTVLPTQTERIVIWTSTPIYTYTPIVMEVTSTPKPEYLCVVAYETVYLRPSASMENYPITPLPNGARLTDMGGKKEEWIFVQYGELSGWVHQKYLKSCK